jgi:hypothetical protein
MTKIMEKFNFPTIKRKQQETKSSGKSVKPSKNRVVAASGLEISPKIILSKIEKIANLQPM